MINIEPEQREVEDWLLSVDYLFNGYVPSDFALEFVNFIKLVNGEEGEENKTPVVHMKMLDNLPGKRQNLANMCHRGLAKTTLFGEYLFLYIAVYGKIPGFGKIDLALYVSDSIENGVKNMRKNLEYRWENSPFLQQYIPRTRFTDVRYEFNNIDGGILIVKGYGAKTGVRGAKEMGKRPQLAVLDDLVSDEDARSATVIASIEDTVYKAVDYALHPNRRKIIWSGTPFNQNDPLYKAIRSGAWYVNVFPVCEHFDEDTTREEFKGSWEDRFDYDYVKSQYTKASKAGKLDTFYQELMLQIMSDDQRIIPDEDIVPYKRSLVLSNKDSFNFYITTDLATSESKTADYGVISVWAVNSNGDKLWIDGSLERQSLDKHLDKLFHLVQIYRPLEVGIEADGQQRGFIPYIKELMLKNNVYFNIAREAGTNKEGLRSANSPGNKHTRFMIMQPQFAMKKIWFPEDMMDTPIMKEAMNELKNVAVGGFNSRKDDFLDTVSQLQFINIISPSESQPLFQNESTGIWEELPNSNNDIKNSYIF